MTVECAKGADAFVFSSRNIVFCRVLGALPLLLRVRNEPSPGQAPFVFSIRHRKEKPITEEKINQTNDKRNEDKTL